ncbi:NAD(P)H-hydrate dehydratase [Prochlorococcus sp. MIT 1223]|uniref:NAD(P)H-hydrate dehydratase n=1 Tax=Prochlorococcus sp. MIT 1223 TaxID=3096217 RepID=UPI002A74B4F6|nr:NAD(P)H-hydrate dehydratase [Prochlorococcus sp. MIT 1223]
MNWPKRDSDHLIVSAEQMKILENQILSSGLPEESLMEKVGQLMTRWFLKNPNLLSNGVFVLIGPGHNGGDGLVVARELHLAGIDVSIWCPIPLKKKLTKNLLSYSLSIGIRCLKTPPEISNQSLWIDAVFGLGQSRDLPKDLADLFKAREKECPNKLVSLDIPSGICSDTGKPFKGGAACARFTLTVGLLKRGLLQDQAVPYVGILKRIDIGIDSKSINKLFDQLPLKISSSDLVELAWPFASPTASKYQRGRVLVISGSRKYMGASFLSMRGALASGAGSIQAALPEIIANMFAPYMPEVVLAGVLEESSNKSSSIGNFIEQINIDQFDALLIGPGLGISTEDSWDVLSEKLQEFLGLIVLDADALNQIALLNKSFEWFQKRKGPSLITPHIYEFRRLFGSLDYSDALDAARQVALNSGAGVLLKGAHSVFSAPSGKTWQIIGTAPWTARAGLGDILAGFLAGVGSIEYASSKKFDWDIIAASILVHAEAAKNCPEGSNANSITSFLASYVRDLNFTKYLERDI